MTTTFENSKGYKVLTLSAAEIKVWARAKVCDRCGRKISSSGFYVGAVNLVYQDLRESRHLGKAIVHIAEALSDKKSKCNLL